MNQKIKKCDFCKKVKYIAYSDYAKNFSLNLCYNCAKQMDFPVQLTTEVICPICKEPFKPFKNEAICWICRKKARGNFGKKKTKVETIHIQQSKKEKGRIFPKCQKQLAIC